MTASRHSGGARPFTYETMNERMIEVVPELRKPYKEYEAEWFAVDDEEPIGPHVVYGDFFNRHLLDLLQRGGDDVELARLFAFVEELAHHPNDKVVNVMDVTVIEGVIASLKGADLARAIRFMGPTSRRLAYERAELFRHCEEIRSLLDTRR